MSNFLLIASCFLAGFFLRKTKMVPHRSHQGINAWIIYVALPAAALYYIPKIQWTNDLLLPILAPIICWIGAWIFTQFVAKWFLLDAPSKAAFFIVAGLGNTSFIGFPLVKAYYGEQYLSIAALCDQVTFTLLTVGATFVAMKQENATHFSVVQVVRKLVVFPPFIAIVVALVVSPFISFQNIDELTKTLAATLSPLALFSVGLQFEIGNWKTDWPTIIAASTYKLILAPTLVFVVLVLFNFTGVSSKIAVFETSMGTMISAGILCEQFQLNPKLSNLIVFTSILLSFATSFGWYIVLEFLVQ